MEGVDCVQGKDAIAGAVLGQRAQGVDDQLAAVGDGHAELEGHEVVAEARAELDTCRPADEATDGKSYRNRPDAVGLLAWLGLPKRDQSSRGEHVSETRRKSPGDDELAHFMEAVERGTRGIDETSLEELVGAAEEVNPCSLPGCAEGTAEDRGVEVEGSPRAWEAGLRRAYARPWGGVEIQQLLEGVRRSRGEARGSEQVRRSRDLTVAQKLADRP